MYRIMIDSLLSSNSSKKVNLINARFRLIGGSDFKIIYRHYATLYFVFCVDSSESELGILDLIQVSWLETLNLQFNCWL